LCLLLLLQLSGKLLSLRAFRLGRTVLRLVTQGLHVWVNKS